MKAEGCRFESGPAHLKIGGPLCLGRHAATAPTAISVIAIEPMVIRPIIRWGRGSIRYGGGPENRWCFGIVQVQILPSPLYETGS